MISSSGRAMPASGRKKRFFILDDLRPVGMAVCFFLATFVRWFHIPSPFGPAVLLMDKPSPMMLLGLGASLGMRLLSGLELDAWQYVGCALLWLMLQKLRPRPGAETAALGGLAVIPRVAAALAQGETLPIVYSCAALPMAMVFAMAFRSGADAARESGAASRPLDKLCLLLIGLVTLSGLGFFRVGPINLGQGFSVMATLLVSAAGGPVYGVLAGLVCGLTLTLGGHDSALAIALCLCGLMGGIARRRWMILPAALLADGIAAWVALGGQFALSPWAAGLGALGAMLVPIQQVDKLKPWLRGMESGSRSMESAFVRQRIAHMREAIEALARALPQCSEEESSPVEEMGEWLCAQCPKRELCWGRSRSRTERMLNEMMTLTQQGEPIDERSELAVQGCLRMDEAPQAAQEALESIRRKQAALQKAHYERELTLTHLAALSGTLSDLGQMAAGESYNDLRAAHIIQTVMEERGISARLRYARRVDGHLQAAIEAFGMTQKALDGLLAALMQEDMPLSVSRAEKGAIELEEIPLYSASVGMASLSAEGAEVCGDACTANRCEGGRLLMMLCDGMGHGEKAHEQSEKTIELLLLLLQAGYTRHQAMKAVNGIMLGTQEERFSTVDLADVDLWTGDVVTEKLGACASWVVRGDHLKKIEGCSLPLGILQEAEPTAGQYRLHSGDILILMSDGVCDAFEEEDKLKKTLLESICIDPQRMADLLLRNALIAGGGTPRDDMSVMVLLLMDRQRG